MLPARRVFNLQFQLSQSVPVALQPGISMYCTRICKINSGARNVYGRTPHIELHSRKQHTTNYASVAAVLRGMLIVSCAIPSQPYHHYYHYLQNLVQIQCFDVSLQSTRHPRVHRGPPTEHNVVVESHTVVHVHLLQHSNKHTGCYAAVLLIQR